MNFNNIKYAIFKNGLYKWDMIDLCLQLILNVNKLNWENELIFFCLGFVRFNICKSVTRHSFVNNEIGLSKNLSIY